MALKLGAKHTVAGPSVNKHVGTFSSEEGVETWSPSSPDLYIWDHKVHVTSNFGDGTGYSISQVPANFNFISNSKIDEHYKGLVDAAVQKGAMAYKGRLEFEWKHVKEVYHSLQSSHASLVLKWKCRGKFEPFGGGGGLIVALEVTVIEFLPPDGLDARQNFHLARLNHPPAQHVANGANLELKTIKVPGGFTGFPPSIQWKRMATISGPQEQLDEIHRVKYTTDQRSDIRTEEGSSPWTLKSIDTFVKAEITMVSGHVVTKQISLS